jgi:hypothetical protein
LLVSGLPRSGTSLLMQMLHAGGCAVMTDGVRAADGDNPAGYFEWEAVKRLAREPRVLDQAGDRVVKVVSPLLAHLPKDRRYRIIFLDRPPEETAVSQNKMLRHLRPARPAEEPAVMAPRLARHREEAMALLRASPHIALLVVPYPELVAAPSHWAAQIAAFVGENRLPYPARMAAAVRPELYRNRQNIGLGDGPKTG